MGQHGAASSKELKLGSLKIPISEFNFKLDNSSCGLREKEEGQEVEL